MSLVCRLAGWLCACVSVVAFVKLLGGQFGIVCHTERDNHAWYFYPPVGSINYVRHIAYSREGVKMTATFQTSSGDVEVEVDLDNEEVRVDGTVQSGEFDEQAQFVLDQVCEGQLERVE